MKSEKVSRPKGSAELKGSIPSAVLAAGEAMPLRKNRRISSATNQVSN